MKKSEALFLGLEFRLGLLLYQNTRALLLQTPNLMLRISGTNFEKTSPTQARHSIPVGNGSVDALVPSSVCHRGDYMFCIGVRKAEASEKEGVARTSLVSKEGLPENGASWLKVYSPWCFMLRLERRSMTMMAWEILTSSPHLLRLKPGLLPKFFSHKLAYCYSIMYPTTQYLVIPIIQTLHCALSVLRHGTENL